MNLNAVEELESELELELQLELELFAIESQRQAIFFATSDAVIFFFLQEVTETRS